MTEPESLSEYLDRLLAEQPEQPLEDRHEELVSAAERRDRDRRHIALAVVWAFIVALASAIAFVALFTGFKPGAWYQIKPAADFLTGLISTVLLPIVTLVLGHYFGSHQAER